MELYHCYYCVIRTNSGLPLFTADRYRNIVIRSLRFLNDKNCIRIHAFALLPDRLLLVWEMLAPDGRLLPYKAFMQRSSQEIRQRLRREHPELFQVAFGAPGGTFWREPVQSVYLNDASIPGMLESIHQAAGYSRFSSRWFYQGGADEFGLMGTGNVVEA